MIRRGREKQRAASIMPGSPAPGRRRRGVWVMIGFSLIAFVVIVIFETQHELARQRQFATPEGEATSETAAVQEATAASAVPVTLLGRLKEHYRAHDLPRGWTVGGVEAPTEAAATVRIVFSPSPQDSRYGQGAPTEDIANGTFCPEGAAFWSGLENRRVAIELGDKSGTVKTIDCDVVGVN